MKPIALTWIIRIGNQQNGYKEKHKTTYINPAAIESFTAYDAQGDDTEIKASVNLIHDDSAYYVAETMAEIRDILERNQNENLAGKNQD